MGFVRPAAIAGTFYPGSARELQATVAFHLSQAGTIDAPVPKAIIAPHAGFIYSGPVAASAYARLKPAHDRIKRVVLLGPCHRVAVRGLAASSADAFATPLGQVPTDKEALGRILALPQVTVFDDTHVQEHSLEVHLPFLQSVLDHFSVVPLVVGDATPDQVAEVLDILWGGPETLILISSDLSHYHGYADARRMDGATCRAIETMDLNAIGHDQACGRIPIRGLLTIAKRKGLDVATVDLRNSGDTAGPKDRVVGYGSWVFTEPTGEKKAEKPQEDAFADATKRLLAEHGVTLLRTAAASILHGLSQGKPLTVDVASFPPPLSSPGASFVTLKRNGNLRGCIGSSIAHRPLIADIAENGYAAAFRDPRFPKLSAQELGDLTLSISVLSAPRPMTIKDERDLLNQLRPHIDGLIIVDGNQRALFLPSVWESLPRPEDFLGHLKRKAGMRPDHWSASFQALRFTAEELSASSLPDPQAIWRT
jgi:AmmeMemoRadiSam system protein B/AmmeMemoRadiSam system protein A